MDGGKILQENGRGDGGAGVASSRTLGVRGVHSLVREATGGGEVQKLIGQGRFGSIFLVNKDPREEAGGGRISHLVAKILLLERSDNSSASWRNMRDEAAVSLERELDILQSLDHHPNIIKFLGCHRNSECLVLLIEFMAGGSLREYIDRVGALEVGDSHLARLTRQLICGVAFLHKTGICHRDLKASNLLLSGDLKSLKLADFGQAKWLTSRSARGLTGSPLWLAPEVVKEEIDASEDFATAHKRADIWSLGCTVVEMTTGKCPWDEAARDLPQALYVIAMSTTPPPLPQKMHPSVQSFVELCCSRNPQLRPTADELMMHELVAEVEYQGSGKATKDPPIILGRANIDSNLANTHKSAAQRKSTGQGQSINRILPISEPNAIETEVVPPIDSFSKPIDKYGSVLHDNDSDFTSSDGAESSDDDYLHGARSQVVTKEPLPKTPVPKLNLSKAISDAQEAANSKGNARTKAQRAFLRNATKFGGGAWRPITSSSTTENRKETNLGVRRSMSDISKSAGTKSAVAASTRSKRSKANDPIRRSRSALSHRERSLSPEEKLLIAETRQSDSVFGDLGSGAEAIHVRATSRRSKRDMKLGASGKERSPIRRRSNLFRARKTAAEELHTSVSLSSASASDSDSSEKDWNTSLFQEIRSPARNRGERSNSALQHRSHSHSQFRSNQKSVGIKSHSLGFSVLSVEPNRPHSARRRKRPKKLKTLVTPQTSAVMAVNLGESGDQDEIGALSSYPDYSSSSSVPPLSPTTNSEGCESDWTDSEESIGAVRVGRPLSASFDFSSHASKAAERGRRGLPALVSRGRSRAASGVRSLSPRIGCRSHDLKLLSDLGSLFVAESGAADKTDKFSRRPQSAGTERSGFLGEVSKQFTTSKHLFCDEEPTAEKHANGSKKEKKSFAASLKPLDSSRLSDAVQSIPPLVLASHSTFPPSTATSEVALSKGRKTAVSSSSRLILQWWLSAARSIVAWSYFGDREENYTDAGIHYAFGVLGEEVTGSWYRAAVASEHVAREMFDSDEDLTATFEIIPVEAGAWLWVQDWTSGTKDNWTEWCYACDESGELFGYYPTAYLATDWEESSSIVSDKVDDVQNIGHDYYIGGTTRNYGTSTAWSGPSVEFRQAEHDDSFEVVATSEFNGGSSEELSFSRGVHIWVKETTNLGWWYGEEMSCGVVGWFPSTSVAVLGDVSYANAFEVMACADYNGLSEEELSIKEGEILTLLDRSDDNWWYGNSEEKGYGWFPSSYVTILRLLPTQQQPQLESHVVVENNALIVEDM